MNADNTQVTIIQGMNVVSKCGLIDASEPSLQMVLYFL